MIGAYRIEGILGRGGMGQVYLAERDAPFKQRVALKIMHRGLDTDDVLRRFNNERQLLAGLNHANIASVFDGGATDDGLPYFVMEYVDGRPITDFCDNRQLTIDARLALFQTVCHAVHAAHQNLIVHRDLKPANILVTDDGTVKLLDFGIAKVLSTEPGITSVTRAGARLLTPDYASPEQLRGESVTTASDVYALGLLLYRLLVGRSADARSQRRAGMSHVPISSPSTALRGYDASESEQIAAARQTSTRQLSRALKGDLDNVVLMALRDEPGRRYGSAQAFADDIGRYRSGMPVAPHADALGYRCKKFLQRHRVSVAAGTILALAIVTFGAVTAWQASQIRNQAIELVRERDKAEQIATFLAGLFEASDPTIRNGAGPDGA